tara:strand:+ start:1252 stop:1650 length:399 start_codon:yes stop_codon:yes gene_type:complete
MTNSKKSLSLKTLLALDAATCAAMGALLLLGSAPIGEVTQIPVGLLFWAGASLIPIAAFMAISSCTTPVPGWAATLVVLGNLLWIAASIFLPTAGLVAPNPLGWAFLFGQVGIVAILTKFEFDTLRGEMIAA